MKESERNELRRRIKEREKHRLEKMKMRELILGGQDGLVNVLGVVLAIASASMDSRLVIIGGAAALFAESISMLAVSYTSSKAANDVYQSELKNENEEVDELPELERQEIWDIFHEKGLRGNILEKVVDRITSDRERWIDVMMKDELNLFPSGQESPLKDALIVGFSAIIGSIIPLIPFLILPVSSAVVWSVTLSAAALFIAGVGFADNGKSKKKKCAKGKSCCTESKKDCCKDKSKTASM